MKLVKAHFENFRLLRDLDLVFGIDPTKKLTVVRAANETGKTTILTALQWALYGDLALPQGGSTFRLHPIDWDIKKSKLVPITVTVEFEVVLYNPVSKGTKESRKRYRIIRSAFEELSGVEWRRSPSTVKLFALTEHGAVAVDAPESMIADELPPDLREVFFTDGDRALSFIESDVAVSTKRERVQKAIRSLLGLGVLEDALRHVKKVAAESNRQAKQVGANSDLERVAAALETLTDDLTQRESERADANTQFVAFDEKLSEIDRTIDDTLKKGDREKLQKELESAKKNVMQLDVRITEATKHHSALFREEAIGSDILAPVLKTAFKMLTELRDRGKIPNATIPVLEERLSTLLCICGEQLKEDGGEGSRRRAHISTLIKQSKQADAVQAVVTDLYFSSKSLEAPSSKGRGRWLTAYRSVVEERDNLQTLRDDAGRRLKGFELQLDSLPDTDIQGLRDVRRQYIGQRDRFNALRSRLDTQIENLSNRSELLTRERDQLLRTQSKGARILSELEVAQDITDVLERSYNRITNQELAKVSELMNRIFLEMIGADPEQGAIVKKAEVSKEFDILVFGPESRHLNPDLDLNGASRRALTLAFILALTKVSEVEAPNVIDTPLGMMSGYVKRSVLRTALRESSQLVLLLTPAEIAGCEEIIDENAGAIITLTNSAHYPKMPVHYPGVGEQRIVRCGCNHRGQCVVCERRPDVETSLELAS